MTLHTEEELRDALHADDREAPVPPPDQLIAAVRGRVRRQRRLAGAGTLTVLAAAGVTVVLILTGGGPRQPGAAATPVGHTTHLCAQPGCHPSLTRSVRRQLHRPLHLPSVAPGGTCPVTPGANYSGPDVGGQRYGHGPVSLVIGDRGDPTLGIVRLGASLVGNWLAAENVLLVDRSYHGAVSVRARQLDGPGVPSLGGEPGPTTFILPPVGNDPGSYPSNTDGSRTPPMTIWTKTPGCYGFQIDGQTFTEKVVIDLTAPTSRRN